MSLTGVGVEILLVYGAELHPPRNGRPGMRATVQRNGDVVVEPVGYEDLAERQKAMHDAMQTCMAAGLQVALRSASGFVTRRKPSCQ